MRPLAIAVALALAAGPALAARLRGTVTLAGPDVRVADLWDGCGQDGARLLGPGPAPGGRITVEAAQLAAIARQFGVDWRPASAAERIVLDRPGRPLAREEVLAALRPALAAHGADPDSDVELAGFVAPMLPPEAAPLLAIDQLDFDAASGRFTATLAVSLAGQPTDRPRLVGRVQAMLELPTLVRRLPPGTVLQAADLRIARLPAALVPADPVRLPAEAVGLALRRTVLPGQPILRASLARPSLIERGARVTMELQSPGLALATVGQAVEAGVLGDRIAVLNPASRAIVQAEITGPGRVRVAPDTLPVRLAEGAPIAAPRLP